MVNQLDLLGNKMVTRRKPGPKPRIKTVAESKVKKPKVARTKEAIGRGSRAKGAQGEREALGLLGEWLFPVYAEFGMDPDKIKRNLDQVTEGGCDLKGLPWLSIEVKRRETVSLGAWWTQTLNQTKPGEIPFLMWRVNRAPWRFRLRVPVVVGPVPVVLDVDMDADAAREWLTKQLRMRLLGAQRGENWFD